MVDLGHGSFFTDDEYIAEARLITPEPRADCENH